MVLSGPHWLSDMLILAAEQVLKKSLDLSNRLIKKLEHTWKSLIHDGVSVFVSP